MPEIILYAKANQTDQTIIEQIQVTKGGEKLMGTLHEDTFWDFEFGGGPYDRGSWLGRMRDGETIKFKLVEVTNE